MTSGEKVFTMMKKKESKYGRGYVEDCQDGNGGRFYAIIDHALYGDEFWIGDLDDVRAELGTHGDGIVFCSVRIFTVH